MTFARRTRFLAALVAVAGLLFAQAAVAMYACSAMGLESAAAFDNANLCEQHCNFGEASLDASQPASNPLPVVVAASVRPVATPDAAAAATAPFAPWPAEGPAPPLIRFTVLRI